MITHIVSGESDDAKYHTRRMVGVALFRPNVSGRLSSSRRKELPRLV